MEKLFEKIARLPALLKLGVLFGTVAIIFGGFFFGVVGGVSAKSDETAELANLKRAKQEFAEAERTKAEEKQECEKLKKTLKKAKRKMRRFRGMLPDDPQISLLIKEIKGKLSGLTLISYARLPEKRKKIYTIIPLDLVVTGSFHSLLKFLHELSIMPRIVNVEDVSLTAPRRVEGKMHLKVQLRLSTFRYRKKRSRRPAKKKNK